MPVAISGIVNKYGRNGKTDSLGGCATDYASCDSVIRCICMIKDSELLTAVIIFGRRIELTDFPGVTCVYAVVRMA